MIEAIKSAFLRSREKSLTNMAKVYSGCNVLQPVSELIVLPLDQLNFVVGMLTALVLSIIYRNALPAHKVGNTIRHVFAVMAGLSLGFFCFGKQMCHLFAQAGSCYLIMRFVPTTFLHTGVLLAALGYLSVMHFLRIMYDYGGYTLDVTGPLMVFTQKLTSLAFSVHDGLYKDESCLSADQKQQAVRRMPSLLEFCSYLFNFQGLLVGPQSFFNDYITFVDGTHLHKLEDMDENAQERHSPLGPSPKVGVIK
ncbi:Membrane-bound O-acyltransferase domain-containing protein 2 [Lamellibrachia satsuma]|nr:Membrane-bound O-acyltransferase domain-containing protein 2 [Lamellibrachia satsuma]